MTKRSCHRRGIAALTAVTMLALVGVTLAALGSLFAAEARRTRDAAAEAQLRQLLIGGATAAGGRIINAAPLTAEMTIELPQALVAERAHLVIRPATSPDVNALIIDVEAGFGEREMRQTLRYVRRDDRWQLAGATLGP